MSEPTDPGTPLPARFELVRSTSDPASIAAAPAPVECAEPKTAPRVRRTMRTSWMPAVGISLLVHAGLFATAACVVVCSAGRLTVGIVDGEAPRLKLDLRTTSIVRTRTREPVLETVLDAHEEPTTPSEARDELVTLQSLEIPPDPEPLIQVEQAPAPSFADSFPPPASEKSITRLPPHAPKVEQGSPTAAGVGDGSALATKSAGGSADGKPGGEGTTSTGNGNGPPLISSGLLHAQHVERPRYPEASRQRGDQGAVTCRLTIGRDGEVIDVVVEESSGFAALDDEAVRALKRWRFKSLEDVTDSPRVQALQRLEFKLGRG